jgi:hypothetical protein
MINPVKDYLDVLIGYFMLASADWSYGILNQVYSGSDQRGNPGKPSSHHHKPMIIDRSIAPLRSDHLVVIESCNMAERHPERRFAIQDDDTTVAIVEEKVLVSSVCSCR